MSRLIGILVFTASIVAGCATGGNKFESDVVSSFVPGKTTFAEAVTLLGGNPVGSSQLPDGSKVYLWQSVEIVLGSSKNDVMTLIFDKEGVFLRESHNYSFGVK